MIVKIKNKALRIAIFENVIEFMQGDDKVNFKYGKYKDDIKDFNIGNEHISNITIYDDSYNEIEIMSFDEAQGDADHEDE